jgi:hypothetical protein
MSTDAKPSEGTKPTNPKDLLGERRVPLALIPLRVLGQLGLAFLEGGIKYGPFNWRKGGVKASTYLSAALRHIISYAEGEEWDPYVLEKTGAKVHHLAKAMACLTIILDAEREGVLEDDRHVSAYTEGWTAENAAAELMREHADELRGGKPLP